ncbi:MAG: response regulator [Spirochaetales bacterium]|nr:response regulator [Spirochaetales bacterium]
MGVEIIKILIVEDSEDDLFLIRELLKSNEITNYIIYEARSGEIGLNKCLENKYDCIILDYKLPDMSGMKFLENLYTLHDMTYIPVIFLTGVGSESIAVSAMKAGAQDYLCKDKISDDVLNRTIRYAINHKRTEVEKEKYYQNLQISLEKIKKLEGMLPICSSCKSIRNDQGYWQQVEDYIKEFTGTNFTHGLCPECAKKYFSEYYESDDES